MRQLIGSSVYLWKQIVPLLFIDLNSCISPDTQEGVIPSFSLVITMCVALHQPPCRCVTLCLRLTPSAEDVHENLFKILIAPKVFPCKD